MVDLKTTAQDVGLVVAVVLFTRVELALEAVLAFNGALDLLEASGRGGASIRRVHAWISFVTSFLVAGVSNLRLWKNREVALMAIKELNMNMMNLRLIPTRVVLDNLISASVTIILIRQFGSLP